MTDVPEAIKAFLTADPTVASLTVGAGGAIMEPELDVNADASMRTVQIVVIKPHGGPPSPATLQINDRRMNILSYAPTPHLANQLDGAVYLALKNLQSVVLAGTYLHWAKLASGPMSMRDPTMQWPYSISSWMVRASDLNAS